MSPPADPAPPHARRLLRRLAALDGPLVQLWAWPGSGLNALLRAFCDEPGGAAHPLPPLPGAGPAPLIPPTCPNPPNPPSPPSPPRQFKATPSSGGAFEAALRAGRSRGCRWFVALAPAEADPGRALPGLQPGERLLFGAPRRLAPGPLTGEVVPPGELLLDAGEIEELSEREGGPRLGREEAERLRLATDGWYRPLREILAARKGGGTGPLEAGELAALPALRAFLRYEVLAPLSVVERNRLARWSEQGGAIAPDEAEAEEHGLWLEEGGEIRLPRLLAAHLSEGRGRRARASVSRGAAHPLGPATGAAPVGYAVALFGSPAIRQLRAGGERPVECRLRRSFQALAFLAASNDLRANRDDLVGALWPNEGERTIERNFHPTLSHLRRSLEGEELGREPAAPIVFRGGVYQLNPALRWEIDTRDFQARVESGRRALTSGDPEGAARDWRAAWKLYRGPFLQGYFDLWVAERRELLQGQYLELLRDFGDVCIRLDRPGEAMDAYRAALVDDPLQERVQVAVMRLYGAQGRRDLVKRQYERLCSLLLEDLGVAPLPQTTEDYHRLMG